MKLSSLFNWYFNDLFKLYFRPIYFFSHLETGSIRDKPLSFLLISAWIFSIAFTLFIYISLVLPTLFILIKGITIVKYLVIIPLFVFFNLVFFVIIALIIGPVFIITTIFLTAIISTILDFIAKKMSGKSNLEMMLKASFYNSSVLIFYSLIPIFSLLALFQQISRNNLHIGISFLIILGMVYLWGLWSISIRKIYGLTRKKSFLTAFIMFVLVLLFYMLVGQKILLILERRLL